MNKISPYLTCIFATILTTLSLVKSSAQAPGISCPNSTLLLEAQNNNSPSFWNSSSFWAPDINSHNLGEMAVDLSIGAKNNCPSGNLNFHYKLYLDLNQDSIPETVIDSDSLPGRDSIFSGNTGGSAFSGTRLAFDNRAVPLNEKYGFEIAETIHTADSSSAKVVWKNDINSSIMPELPYGTHYIEWTITDDCGQSSSCSYAFTIRDGKLPEIACINGLSVNLMNIQGGLVQLYASDFIMYAMDNYTPGQLLKIAVRKTGTGTGFPLKPDGTPQTGISFICADLGTQLVELWVLDKAGNADFCETFVLVQDNMNVCTMNPQMVLGQIQTEIAAGIENVEVEFNNFGNGIPGIGTSILTNSNGEYLFSNAFPFSSLNITPTLDIDPLNGVNTWDLILISKHILGLEPLNSPYKMIAADANKSGTLTTFDIVELRKLILGTYTHLPSNKSWRFVDAWQTFSNPMNPFADDIRESLIYSSSMGNFPFGFDFIGCKIGDVDNSNIPNNFSTTNDRTISPYFLQTEDQLVEKGESYTLKFTAVNPLTGLQFTLRSAGLTPEAIIEKQGIFKENFAFFKENEQNTLLTAAFENTVTAFEINFTATANGRLSEMLQISSDITPALAFDAAGNRYAPSLLFTHSDNQTGTFSIAPNPWKTATAIGFSVEQTGEIQICVTDQNGKIILQKTQQASAGFQQINLTEKDISQPGIYFITIKTDTKYITQKTIKI